MTIHITAMAVYTCTYDNNNNKIKRLILSYITDVKHLVVRNLDN